MIITQDTLQTSLIYEMKCSLLITISAFIGKILIFIFCGSDMQLFVSSIGKLSFTFGKSCIFLCFLSIALLLPVASLVITSDYAGETLID